MLLFQVNEEEYLKFRRLIMSWTPLLVIKFFSILSAKNFFSRKWPIFGSVKKILTDGNFLFITLFLSYICISKYLKICGNRYNTKRKKSSYEINRSFTLLFIYLFFFCKSLWKFIGEELKEELKVVLFRLFLFIRNIQVIKSTKSKSLSTKHFVRQKLRKFD